MRTIKDFEKIPCSKVGYKALGCGHGGDGADITTSYALINGKRSVYLAITKSADASTWDVVQNLKNPRFRLYCEDVTLSYQFDQSGCDQCRKKFIE
jgi:hypothetical protein